LARDEVSPVAVRTGHEGITTEGRVMVIAEDLEELVAAAAATDETAWQRLWAAIEPALLRLVAQPHFLGRLGQHEDDRRNIVVAVMARLRADRFHRLNLYLEARRANPRLKFMTWLRIVTKRVGIDYMRAQPEWLRRDDSQASAPGRWVVPGTLPPGSQLYGDRPPITSRQTARELLQFAAGVLPREQLVALELWTHGESFTAIARAVGWSGAEQAERTIRAALERLRRKFRVAAGG
jgi:DNA-directed RNA polymerase specialized sigma24 family protein